MLKPETNSNTVRDSRQQFTFTVRRKTNYVVRTVEVPDDNDRSKMVKQKERFFDYTVQLWANSAGAAVNKLRSIIDQEVDTFVLEKDDLARAA
jgi:hypothetical protein